MINATFTGNELVLLLQTTSWQYDTGQVLCISGISELNAHTEVHFERKLYGDAVVKKGAYDSENGTLTVDIPNVFFEYADGTPGRVWVYPRADEEIGQTVREIDIPIAGRERPDDYISPEDPGTEEYITAVVQAYLDEHSDSFMGYTKSETDSLLRERAPSVKDYGAKGDGVTDDTDAIYKAIVRNDVVYFPPGTYRTAGIIITNPNENKNAKTLFGAGRKSVIKPITVEGYFCKSCGHVVRGELPDSSYKCDCGKDRSFLTPINNNAVIRIGANAADKVDECTISDLTIDARVQEKETTDEGTIPESRYSRGVFLYATNRTVIRNVAVYRADNNGFEIASGAHDCQFSDIKVKYCGQHGVMHYGFGNSFANVETSQNTGNGIFITAGGCQFANVKAWANCAAGLRISGAKHCMIANVNSQQNRGSGLVIEGNAAYNVVTGFESVGNNYTLNNESNAWNPNITFEGGSGLVVGGHDNAVQGSDVRAKWEDDWRAVEKSALYLPETAHDNRVDLVCAEGDTALSDIYKHVAFANIGFDRSVLLVKHNRDNHVRVNGRQIDMATLNGEAAALDYSNVTLSTLGGLNDNAEVEVTGNGKRFTVTGKATSPKAINDIVPRSLAGSCSTHESGVIEGTFWTTVDGRNIKVAYPALIAYSVPISQITANKLLKITFEAKLTAEDRWIAVPILRLSNGNTERFINNKLADTEARGIVNADNYATRTFSYLLSADKLGETQWTDCRLILALLKTAAAESTDETPHTVTLDINELTCSASSVLDVDGSEFDETHYTKAEIDAAIQAAIGGVENGAY